MALEITCVQSIACSSNSWIHAKCCVQPVDADKCHLILGFFSGFFFFGRICVLFLQHSKPVHPFLSLRGQGSFENPRVHNFLNGKYKHAFHA